MSSISFMILNVATRLCRSRATWFGLSFSLPFSGGVGARLAEARRGGGGCFKSPLLLKEGSGPVSPRLIEAEVVPFFSLPFKGGVGARLAKAHRGGGGCFKSPLLLKEGSGGG
jgi:hypothetical protein